MVFLRSRFARGSRDLKRLEGVSRSPVYSYFSASVQGSKVIRSYGAEKTCSDEFLNYLDTNTRANYLSHVTARWAAIRFDWVSLGFITLVASFAIIVRATQYKLSAVDITLTLVYGLNLINYLQWTVRC